MDKKELRRQAIERNLLDFVAAASFTNGDENRVLPFFERWLGDIEYFRQNPQNCGFYPIPNDSHARFVPWCLLKGEGDKTVVLVHHCDVVDTLDYGKLEHLALKPAELTQEFKNGAVELPPDALADALSGDWLFGRGVGDMKGGGAIQLALIEEYARETGFKGNIVLFSAPDEENLSAGMIAAISLLRELKQKHGLDYACMINCEPHDRDDFARPTIYRGSIGKLMPVFFVRGKLAHVGHVYDGLSPVNILSEIIRRTELNPDFIERVGSTTSPAPAYLSARDRKPVYDVSLPFTASGCLSILPLARSAPEIVGQLREIAAQAFDNVIEDANESYRKYCGVAGITYRELPWKTRVVLYSELYEQALRDSGGAFAGAHGALMRELKAKLSANEITTISCANAIIEKTLEYTKDLSPVIVIALAPPYYPSAHNSLVGGQKAERAEETERAVIARCEQLFGQQMASRDYYVAISDLSYACFAGEYETIAFIEQNMVMWGGMYYIPLEQIRELSMPVLNIGPWGKNLHKYVERVYLPDLYYRTPELLDFAIRELLTQ